MSSAAPVQFVPTPVPEEAARADFYALIARLFYAPPDEMLLKTLASAGDLDPPDSALAEAWNELKADAGRTSSEAVRLEYDATFVGTGKAPVTPYLCAYSIRYSNEAPLVELRSALAALGLGRRSEATEPEDHIAALCDVMRHLIAEQKRSVGEQKAFFERWLWPPVMTLCDAITQAEGTDFYRSVAAFTRAFTQLEHSAFDLL